MGSRSFPCCPARADMTYANAASCRGVRAAIEALHDPTPGPSVDDGLAERERFRAHGEARGSAQGDLFWGSSQ